jgi:hypothetical protein
MSVHELVRVRRRFAGRPDQIAEARRLVSRVIGSKSPAHDVARLLISEAATDALGGRGLELLDALATRWGSSGGPGGHTVWFELDVV